MLCRLVRVSSRHPCRDWLATACADARGARNQPGRADGARPPPGAGPPTRAAASNLSEAAHHHLAPRDAGARRTLVTTRLRTASGWLRARIAEATHEGLHARHCRSLPCPPMPPARESPSRLRYSREAQAQSPPSWSTTRLCTASRSRTGTAPRCRPRENRRRAAWNGRCRRRTVRGGCAG
jgi:hypothetical protein